jgi:hypothetical protein
MNAEEVFSAEQLALFVSELRKEFLRNSDTWENGTLERFLEALSAWAKDSDGYFENNGPQPTPQAWNLLAQALAAAAVYE